MQSSKRRCVSYASLRALFLGILCLLIASLALAMTHPMPPRKGGEMTKWEHDFKRT